MAHLDERCWGGGSSLAPHDDMTNQRDKTTAREDSQAAKPASAHPGSERDRDEQRNNAGPQYGGGEWQEADRRGDARFGQARNDDAGPPELAAREAEHDKDDAPEEADPDLAAGGDTGEIESGGQRAGMGRGEKPRKLKAQET